MTDNAMTDKGRGAEEEINIFALAAIILRRWRLIAGAVVATVLLAVVSIALRSDEYIARTVVMPPPNKGGGGALALAQQLPAGLAGGLAGGQDSDQARIGVILKSRSLADSMVSRLTAGSTPDPEREAAIRLAIADAQTEELPDGSVGVIVSAEDPELAASLANEVPELLNVVSTRVGAQTALRKQDFLQRQLENARENLLRAEQKLVAFQEGHDVPEAAEQAKRTMEAAADLQEQIIAKEVEVTQLRRTATSNHPALRAAMSELAALRQQLQRLSSGGLGSSVFLSLKDSPELKVDAARVMREFAQYEQMYVALTAALAQAQIDANNNLPIVSVLDPALVPSSPSRPSTPLVLGLAALLGLVAGVFLAFASEALQSARRNPANESLFAAWDQFKADLSGYMPHRWRRRANVSAAG
jgi:tyrosine-protein kinase Etk/Wzc